MNLCLNINQVDRLFAKRLCLFLVISTFSSMNLALEKVVRCQVDSGGNPDFKGQCLFMSEKGGSFSLRNINKSKPIIEGVTDINVYILDKDVADVRGLTIDGINSRWGDAHRSTKDKACWVGTDFKVCAW